MRYKVTVAYDGSEYHGWQTQRKGNSIEEAIEKVLYTMHDSEVEIVGSGRTDSKVHALGQVFHFDSSLGLSKERMKEALNAQLNRSIRIKTVEIVSDDFHARFDAKGKRYEYFVSKDTSNPFIRKYMDIDYHPLALKAMQEAATIFVGTHDFTSFTSSKIDQRKGRIRTITKFEVSQDGDVTHFVIEGDGFLRYMVRMMVQTIIMVGKGKVSIEEVEQMLLAKNKHTCKYKANACGLYLVEVKY
ncbi:tRNA pseudouridine38-40 synthase [Breznakia sp. PF5-3]|uniref:tRNA pseudouridine(38-40) synthase TruA n=1 Tax=unclassified Breznakia TaxID=2623764 RepID=UPI0024075732|nr:MULTISPECIES: tRNA pseudouridine(38-40) synthase TruA [unclassified Breznakia]MDF9825135.1 tRNA pseudouridine38-40 synthase [Breznakia sp. PM6-1]MDF9836006.1 tRNA pseudouridine38-40 synthase [Breznakia sp. PF5-3]MDF9838104.1 tRNA pseudouridine38-40 synthase [Breznakia sp. PFB2-8]MDF9860066.1 tRNA pseudouridine38-40 synthase [Breznakia sp. PH5-24]